MKTTRQLSTKGIRQFDAGVINLGYDGDLRIQISGKIIPGDGSEPYEAFPPRQGHSFTRGFVEALYAHMSGLYDASGENISGKGPYIQAGTYDFAETITGHTVGSPARIILTAANSNNLDNRWVQIHEATHTGGTPSLLVNNSLNLNYVTTNTFDCYTDLAHTVPYDTTGDGVYDALSGSIWNWEVDAGMHFANLATLRAPEIYVGFGTTAVNIVDIFPAKWSQHLYAGAQGTTSIDIPNVSATKSFIRLTRNFQNTSGGVLTVEEMVIYCDGSNDQKLPANMIARDLQTIVIPDASTLVLYYDLETTVDITAGSATLGGITQWFNSILYRQLANVAENAKDLNNVDEGSASQINNFIAISASGDQRLRPYASSSLNSIPYETNNRANYLSGPLLGTGNNTDLPMAQDNFDLAFRIPHGTGPGELYHFGTVVEDLEIRGGGWGTITLTGGGGGSAAGITVNGVQVMSGAEAFDTDLTTTATNIAANVTAFVGTGGYTASSRGRVVTLKAGDTIGSAADGHVVAASPAWTTITSSVTAVANGNSGQFKIRRLFKNESGEDIVVTEAGLAVGIKDSTTGYNSLIARYIHDGAAGRPASTTIANGEVAEAVITIRASV